MISILTVCLVLTGICNAKTNTMSGTVEIPVFSEFNWRGMRSQDETVFQPNITVVKDIGCGVVLVNTWLNIAPNQYWDKGDNAFNEVDVTIAYANEYKKVGYEVGLIEYVYSGLDINNTHEGYVKVGYDTILSPTVTTFYDFKEVEGMYGLASVSHTIDFLSNWSITADTGVGYATANYNDFYYGVDKDGLNDWNSGLTLAVKVLDNVVLSTGVRYVDLVDGDIVDGANLIYGSDDSVVTKFSATIDF